MRVPGSDRSQPSRPDGPAVEVGLEQLLVRLAVEFVNVHSDDLDRAIDRALAEVGRFSGVSRAYLFRYDHERRTVSNTHEWCAPGVAPSIHDEQDVAFDTIPDQLEAHLANQIRHVPNVAELPHNAPWRARLEAQQIVTLVTVPLWDHDQLIGFVGFDAIDAPRRWSERDLKLLRVLGELLANAEFRRRQADAQRTIESLSLTNQELQRFAGTASHDLRSPLATVRGMLALLRDGQVNPADRERVLERVIGTVDRTISLVDGLLAHALSGRVLGEPEPVDLDVVMVAVRESLAHDITRRGARFEHSPLPTVAGDRERLVSVFQNLVANALVHVPEDRVPVIALSASPAIDGRVEVLVRDNGVGIPPDHRQAALETFSRSDGVGGRPGSGLGLAICRRIVAAHGGTLELGEAPDGGLEVRVRLPVSG